MPDPVEVRSMFARIAGRYDLLNRTLSLGIDQRWRKTVVERAGELEGRTVLDVCCGTGDLALAFAARGARVVAADFTHEMLVRATPKRGADACLFVRGDAMRLPVPDDVFDMASVAFGIRNVADRLGCLEELSRVVRPGGRVFVLEFSPPQRGPVAAVYRTYFTRLLPRIGAAISGDGAAYRYLPRTVLEWPDPDAFEDELRSVGLVDCAHETWTLGIASLHHGRVPGASA